MNTYSFLSVNATLTGPLGIIDFSAGAGIADEGITIAPTGDKNTMTIGADGEGMHSLHADKSGTVTVRVLKTSNLNAKMMAMFAGQTASAVLHGQNVITVSNAQSGDSTVCRQCAFKKKADVSYGKEGGMMEWVFEAVKIDTILGTY